METFNPWKVQSTQINMVGKTVVQAEAIIRTHGARLGIDPDELWDMLLVASVAYVKTLRVCGDNALLVVYRNRKDSILNVANRSTEPIQAGNSVRATLRVYTPHSGHAISQTIVHYSNSFISEAGAQAQLLKIVAEAEREK